ncbi:hypothetical protein [Paraburkholderia caballeronis]|uniref:Uncharacterized protein n=1 Tax=Paraburkholderia caballeronis TaxID=416943 RepID=A0A1H7I9S6_9BURK|nr:hypothetical protein [Paraburkholderia caballeronis]PXW29160.1 hypothetical protein C7403_10111 [Paraburkholderia caballeronis]PXX04419.1 hypothetical protein C7407_10111 [Paraburkholderia caballeronis]RAK05480.1 hypothetical protein C7409_10111 [Paraburkholderia caballeronis]SEC88901.1 hypothetical protein SAMN05445871_3055 [Paraburkholderia caballeronis]SEK59188.1 hypothetical protein SAMN05192542_102624 [Paraburkholderia caballeronis]
MCMLLRSSPAASAPRARPHLTQAAFVFVLAAAVSAVCAAYPSIAHAQANSANAAASTSAAGSPGASQQKNDDDLPAATRRARADERRLLGGPRSTFDPYASDDSSPASQEDALMSEQRMTIVSPSQFFAAGSMTSGDPGSDGGGGGSIRRFGRAGNASDANGAGGQGGGSGASSRYRYGSASASPVYRDPYEAQRTAAGQPYRSPW